MAILAGDDPAVVQMGWGLVKDMNDGLKKAREESGAASDLRICSQ